MKVKYVISIIFLMCLNSYATLSPAYTPQQYDCDGATTSFPFGYKFFEASDLNVYVTYTNGVTTTLVNGSGAGKFTIYAPNADYSSGATITTGTTYDSDYYITIERAVPLGQTLDLAVDADHIEQALDKLAAQIQQVDDENDRSITFPVTDPVGVNGILPAVVLRAGKMLVFDTDGSVLASEIPVAGTNEISGEFLQAQIDVNTAAIAVNEIDIAANVVDIATNVLDIATNVSGIATNVIDIATNVINIATNTADIIRKADKDAGNVTDDSAWRTALSLGTASTNDATAFVLESTRDVADGFAGLDSDGKLNIDTLAIFAGDYRDYDE